MVNLRVIKKNGIIEDFNPKKIEEICIRAGLLPSSAEIVANEIEHRLIHIKSSKIRNKLHKTLKKIDKKAAKRYRKFYIEGD
jgi:transcriptional regulator NrdR family protein